MSAGRGKRRRRSRRAAALRAAALALLLGLLVTPGPSAPAASHAVGVTAATEARAHESREGTWRWPVDGPRHVLRSFDPPAQRWGRGHRGVDLLAPAGGTVRAVADGVVSYSGEIAGVGVVAVTHPGGLRSTYQPVADRTIAGQRVLAGERLGTLAHGIYGHCRPLSCLHLGAVTGRDAYQDPELLLRGWQIRLLPLRPPGTGALRTGWPRLLPR